MDYGAGINHAYTRLGQLLLYNWLCFSFHICFVVVCKLVLLSIWYQKWLFSGVYLSIIIWRWKRKDKREFKVPLIIPVITLLTTSVSIMLPIIQEPNWAYFYAAMVVFAGYLFYIPFFELGWKAPFSDSVYKFLQLYFESVPEVYKRDW